MRQNVEIVYRRATTKDLRAVARVFARTIDRLNKDHGFFDGPTRVSPPNPQYSFWLKKNPDSFFVAETDGEIVGYSFSYLRGPLWFLADLFVLPGNQGKGIGKTLIEKTLGSLCDRRVVTKAVITPAFNPVSASLYMQFGMLPRQPVYYASAPRTWVEKSLPPERREIEVTEVAGDSAVDVADDIHQRVLGIPAGWHNEFFLREQHASCLVFKRGDSPEGYAFVRSDGGVGPFLVAHRSSFRPAFLSALRSAADMGCDGITVLFAGTNSEAADVCLRLGFRIGYPLLFMSSEPMGDWDNYLFHSPAFM